MQAPVWRAVWLRTAAAGAVACGLAAGLTACQKSAEQADAKVREEPKKVREALDAQVGLIRGQGDEPWYKDAKAPIPSQAGVDQQLQALKGQLQKLDEQRKALSEKRNQAEEQARGLFEEADKATG